MKQKFAFQLSTVAIATTLALTACGGGSSSKSTPVSQSATGVFLDSAVQGLEVLQNGKSLGKTNEKGEYTYVVSGGAVTFKLGELTLGSTMPKAVITPADLTTNSQQLVRTLQILQSADNDNNPTNGIQISETVAKRFEAKDFNTLVQETDDTKFETALKPKLNTNQSVKTTEQATTHFQNTVQSSTVANSSDLSTVTDKFVGYWQQGCDEGSREVFQLKKINATTLVSTGQVLIRKYDNDDCSGTFVDSSYDGDKEPFTVQVLAQTNENNRQIVNLLLTEVDDDGKTKTDLGSVVLSNNQFVSTNDGLTFTRANGLTFANVVTTPTDAEAVQLLTNYLHNKYWKSCYETKFGSEISFLSSTVNNTQVTFTKVYEQEFDNKTCSGTPKKSQTKNEINEENFSGVVKQGSTLTKISGSGSFVMSNANSFSVGNNHFTQISASDVPR